MPVKAIVTMTHSGYTAFKISSMRPKANIYAFTSNPSILCMLNLVWGVRAHYYDKTVSTDHTIADITGVVMSSKKTSMAPSATRRMILTLCQPSVQGVPLVVLVEILTRSFLSTIRWATRYVRTRVLPEPAPATTRSGPSVCRTASRWASLRSARELWEGATAIRRC